MSTCDIYLVPQIHKCDKCGYEKEVDPNKPNILMYYCDKCLREFLDQHVGKMIWTIEPKVIKDE